MELTEEMLEKAKCANDVAELITLAAESGIKLTEEDARGYFERLHPASGELPDEELDNIAGGGCGGNYNSAGFAIYPYNHVCDLFWCEYCGKRRGTGTHHTCTPIGGGETTERGTWCRNCFSCNPAERNTDKITCFKYCNKKK